MRRIIISFARIDNAIKIRDILTGQGFIVEGICQSGAQTINLAKKMNDGIIITGYKLTDMVAPQLLDIIPYNIDVLMLLNPGQLEISPREDIFSLILPVNKADLISSVSMMLDIKKPQKKKLSQAKKERTKEENNIIIKAKELLIDRNNMTEEQAHRFIQKSSMDSGTNMIDMAKLILER